MIFYRVPSLPFKRVFKSSLLKTFLNFSFNLTADSMKAIQINSFGGPKVLQLQDVSIPSISGSQILVKIMSAGVNPVDTYIREGQFSNLPELPFTPGKDGAGIVEKVGEEVTKFVEGQRVFVCKLHKEAQHGTYAEYAVVEENDTFPLDSRISFDQGAAIGIPYFTAHRALFTKGNLKPGETVLIHGASGAVGLAAVQLAKNFKALVIGTAGTSEGIKIVKDNGADHVLCHKDSGYLDNIMELTDNKGVDVIIEMLANVNLAKDIEMLSPNGCVMIVGARGSVNINPRFMMLPETKIIGVALMASTKDEWEETSSSIIKGIKDGYLTPVVDRTYTLEECQDAHRDIIKSKGAKGNLVLSATKIFLTY